MKQFLSIGWVNEAIRQEAAEILKTKETLLLLIFFILAILTTLKITFTCS